jgi:hypothetical protein
MNQPFTHIERLFTAILAQSIAVQGRFKLLARNGAELNQDEVQELTHEFTNNKAAFPVAAMLTPRLIGEVGVLNDYKEVAITMFFLDTTHYNASGQVKNPVPQTGKSGDDAIDEWDRMGKVALDFVRVLMDVTKPVNNPTSKFRVRQQRYFIDPVSYVSSNRLSGVRLQFTGEIFVGCDITDYPPTIQIPE